MESCSEFWIDPRQKLTEFTTPTLLAPWLHPCPKKPDYECMQREHFHIIIYNCTCLETCTWRRSTSSQVFRYFGGNKFQGKKRRGQLASLHGETDASCRRIKYKLGAANMSLQKWMGSGRTRGWALLCDGMLCYYFLFSSGRRKQCMNGKKFN